MSSSEEIYFTEILKLAADSNGNVEFIKGISEAILDYSESESFLNFITRNNNTGNPRRLGRPLLRIIERNIEEEVESNLQNLRLQKLERKKKTDYFYDDESFSREELVLQNHDHDESFSREELVLQNRIIETLLDAHINSLTGIVNLSANKKLSTTFIELQAIKRIYSNVFSTYYKFYGEVVRRKAVKEEIKKETKQKRNQRDFFLDSLLPHQGVIAEILQLCLMVISNLSGTVVEKEQEENQKNSFKNETTTTTSEDLLTVTNHLVYFYNLPPIDMERDLLYHVGGIIKNLTLIKAGRKLISNPINLAPLSAMLQARHRRKHILEIFHNLALDIDCHQAIKDAHFLPEICSYLVGDSHPLFPDSDLHPVVLESLVDKTGFMTQDVSIRETALQIFYTLTKTTIGKDALIDQGVRPILGRWKFVTNATTANIDSKTTTIDAETLKKENVILEVMYSMLKGGELKPQAGEDIDLNSGLVITIDPKTGDVLDAAIAGEGSGGVSGTKFAEDVSGRNANGVSATTPGKTLDETVENSSTKSSACPATTAIIPESATLASATSGFDPGKGKSSLDACLDNLITKLSAEKEKSGDLAGKIKITEGTKITNAILGIPPADYEDGEVLDVPCLF